MSNSGKTNGIAFSKRLYGKLQRLYPAKFRKDHSASMQQVFSDMLRDAHTERKSLSIPWLRVVREMPLSILKEHMDVIDATSPKKIKLQISFALPSLQSFMPAILVFVVQMGIFLGAVYLLYSSYHPQIPEYLQVPSDWELSWNLYPYLVFEIGIFLCASAIAFWISRWGQRMISALFAAEIGALLFTQLLSYVWGNPCSILITTSHWPALGYPSCGISSLNVYTFAFNFSPS
jgi:hypothetical protein